MKITSRISIWLNLALLGGLIFLLTNQRQPAPASAPVLSAAGPSAQVTVPAPAAPAGVEPGLLRWNQLVSTGDYRTYIANLRAIGCPEPTVEDIVRGDAARAFSWERRQSGLDGSGAGPWSRSQEMQLVASLLGVHPPAGTTIVAQNSGNETAGNGGGGNVAETTTPVQRVGDHMRRGSGNDEVADASLPSSSAGMESPSYPLFLQNPDWAALGFTAEQQAAIAQVRQQFQNAVGSLNQNYGAAANPNAGTTGTGGGSSNPGSNNPLNQWQNALQGANQQLHGLLGSQAYLAYEQQQYNAWYFPQVAAATGNGESVSINPGAFH